MAKKGKGKKGKKKEVVEVDDSGKAPPGCRAVMMSMKQMDKYELKTGDGLKDTVRYKLFSKEWILEEIRAIGFYSAFNEFKDKIEAYPQDDILVICDPDELYGENWYMCVTQESYEKEWSKLRAEEEKLEAERRAREEERKRKEEEERRAANVVYEDKPFLPSAEYASETKEETQREVDELGLRRRLRGRCPLIKYRISRQRKHFGSSCTFNDRDAEQSGLFEFRQHKDPNFELKRRTADAGVQASPSYTEAWLPLSPWKGEESGTAHAHEMPSMRTAGSQTSYNIKQNAAVQYASVGLSADEQRDRASGDAYESFCRSAARLVEDALMMNETVDVFRNEFAALVTSEDDAHGIAALGNKSESLVKELRTFTDLVHSKNKHLGHLDWHPTRSDVVAVSCVEPVAFDERVERTGRAPTDAFLLVWNFADPIHPQLILKSPHEVLRFAYNPSAPTIIAGGCINGQVLLWDIAESLEQHSRLRKRGTAAENPEDGGEEESATVAPVEPIAISTIDNSHKRGVADLQWLPRGIEVNRRAQVIADSSSSSSSVCQFMTISGDGQVCVWDTRYKELAAKSKSSKAHKEGDEIPWNPACTYGLHKLEGGGLMELSCFSLRGFASLGEIGSSAKDSEKAKGSLMTVATSEGEIAFVDWSPGRSSEAAGGGSGNAAPEKQQQQQHHPAEDAPHREKVIWMKRDHWGKCSCLARSPFFSEIVLSVGPSSFSLWREGRSVPIFTSPSTASRIVGAVWSPVRPGVIVVGRADGNIDAWDFCEQSHAPSTTLPAASCAITSMKFSKSSRSDVHYLGVGDESGNLHILDIPRSLCRPAVSERRRVREFFSRELKRFGGDDGAAAAAAMDFHDGIVHDSAPHETDDGSDALPLGDARSPPSTNEEYKRELTEEERRYKRLEERFRKQHGLA